MTDDTKCRCGAYAKPELRHRGTKALCCSRCYDESWWNHAQEWEEENRRYQSACYDDDYGWSPE